MQTSITSPGLVIASMTAALTISTPAFADLSRIRPLPSPIRRYAKSPPQTGGGASADDAASEGDTQATIPNAPPSKPIRDADVGDIMRAGCEPTLAQMSKLMDNPLGNVAMLFTQFDIYQLKEPNTGRTEDKYNYMGIAQFPKSLGENWNLINRIVWNVPSMPLNQNKIDKAERASALLGDLQGAVLPPAGSPVAPIDLFGGRTTGFGDMYYVGLFSPKKPTTWRNGSSSGAWGSTSCSRPPARISSVPANGERGHRPWASTSGRSGRSAPWRSSTGTLPATATGTTST